MFSRPTVSEPLTGAAESRTPGGTSFWSSILKGSPFSAASPRSTVASESDLRLPPAKSSEVASEVASVPLAFSAGLSLGTVVAAACLVAVGFHPTAKSAPFMAQKSPYASAMPPEVVPAEYLSASPLNNSCLIKQLAIPDGPQTFDACGFVIRSTDEVWNLRGDVDAAIEKYFHEEYMNAGSWGRRGIGKKALREAVLAEMRAFPDIQIHITDCVCKGNDNDGYKCAMPDVLTGTNLGPSSYGPATGRYARWTGLVESLVRRNPATGQWQYYAEWGVHDEWALIQQLGLDFDRVPRPAVNSEPLHDCEPLLRFAPIASMDKDDLMIQAQHAAAKSAA